MKSRGIGDLNRYWTYPGVDVSDRRDRGLKSCPHY